MNTTAGRESRGVTASAGSLAAELLSRGWIARVIEPKDGRAAMCTILEDDQQRPADITVYDLGTNNTTYSGFRWDIAGDIHAARQPIEAAELADSVLSTLDEPCD
jgi:hypothetical protein